MGRPAGRQGCCSHPLQQSTGMGLQQKEEKIKPREWCFLKPEQMPAEFLCGGNGWLDLLLFCTEQEKSGLDLLGEYFIPSQSVWVCVPMHAAHAHLFPMVKSASIYLWKGFSQGFFAFDRFKTRPSKILCANFTQDFEICWLSLKVKWGASQFWCWMDRNWFEMVSNGFKWFKIYLDIVFSIFSAWSVLWEW